MLVKKLKGVSTVPWFNSWLHVDICRIVFANLPHQDEDLFTVLTEGVGAMGGASNHLGLMGGIVGWRIGGRGRNCFLVPNYVCQGNFRESRALRQVLLYGLHRLEPVLVVYLGFVRWFHKGFLPFLKLTQLTDGVHGDVSRSSRSRNASTVPKPKGK